MDDVVYVGQSQALHWWPRVRCSRSPCPWPGPSAATGHAMLVSRSSPRSSWACSCPGASRCSKRGIALWFPFGKYRYLDKAQVTVRVGLGPTVLLPVSRRPVSATRSPTASWSGGAYCEPRSRSTATTSRGDYAGRGVDQAVAAADRALERAEHERVDERCR